MFKFSPDGTAASLAYSQSNYISILQLASLTGITGISFLLTLVPSAIAVNWWFWRKNRKSFAPLAIAGMILLMAIGFGYYRSLEVWKTRTISVGLVSMPEESHDMSAFPDSARTAMNLARYDSAISSLARRGAKLVVLPERALYINRTNENVVMNALLKRAAENNIFIVAGYTNQKNSTERNSSLVIDDSGRLVCDYNKIHLVKGLEKRFTPGGSIATYSMVSILAGTAICKDLDFPDNIIDYGRSGVSLLAVPAWDFGQDGWLHSRMAVLRGLENGFSVARSARQGRLTLSDGRGHILSETSTARGQEALLVGQLPLSQVPTLYRRWGDWFGWLNLFGLVILLGISGRIILSNSRPNQNRTSSK